ncbi:integrase [Streptomyces violarus]|uniref:Integrase n=1 Tax=Streptomyces violarus TaxID=67380 RepID=A0A7W5F0J3_9ACTN|nr:site-specific integrase [Streptomyces violarus]MBB3075586.1 integrase [Streptomyces violarus]
MRWRDEGRRERRRSFTKKGDADKFAAKVTTDLERGHYIDPDAPKKPLREVCQAWLSGAEHRPTTAQGAERQLRVWVYPYLGDRAVGGLKRGDIENWLKIVRKTLADSTTAITYGRLKAVLTWAVHNDMIVKNPCDGIKAPSTRRPEIVPLPQEAVAALVAAAPPRYRAMILLAAGSGLRMGELVGLELRDLDLANGEVHVRQQAVRLDQGDPYIGPPKTDQSYRTVPLAKSVTEALIEHVRRFPPVAVSLADQTDPRHPHKRTVLLVFPSGGGRTAINGGNWSGVWSNLRNRANAALEEGDSPVRVPQSASMHDMRHFYASMLILHRESIKTVQKRLGHAKPSVTLDVYTHLFEEVEDTTRDAVQNVLGSISVEY